MVDLVTNWVLNKLGLPVPQFTEPAELTKFMSNGYIFAEILRKYSIISDDQMIALSRNYTEKTKLKNMKYVQRWMTERGIYVQMIDLLDVAEEKSGAFMRILYLLYFGVEGGRGEGQKRKLMENEKMLISIEGGYNDLEFESIREARTVLELVASESQRVPSSFSKSIHSSGFNPSREDSYFEPGARPIPKCIKVGEIGVAGDVDNYFQVEEKLMECPLIVQSVDIRTAAKRDTRDASEFYFAGLASLEAKKVSELCSQKRRATFSSAEENGKIGLTQFDFQLLSKEEREAIAKMKAKLETESRLAQEMNAYDSLRFEGEDVFDSCAEPVVPNSSAAATRLRRLKSLRKEEEEDSCRRIRLRHSLSAQLLKNIPEQISKELLDCCMERAGSGCSKEQELVQFLKETYKSKTVFLEHLALEQTELQKLAIIREEDLRRHTEKEEEMSLLTTFLDTFRASRLGEERLDKDSAAVDKMIRDQLKLIIRLALRIAEYKASNNGTDPPPELISEWKTWLALGLPTPSPSESTMSRRSSEVGEFWIMAGECELPLASGPIPKELNPNYAHNKDKLKEQAINEGQSAEEEDAEENGEEEETTFLLTPPKGQDSGGHAQKRHSKHRTSTGQGQKDKNSLDAKKGTKGKGKKLSTAHHKSTHK